MMLTLIYIILLIGVFMIAGMIGVLGDAVFAQSNGRTIETGLIFGALGLICCLVYLAVKFNPLGIQL